MISEEEPENYYQQMKADRDSYHYYLLSKPKPEEPHCVYCHNELVAIPRRKTIRICRGCGVKYKKTGRNKKLL